MLVILLLLLCIINMNFFEMESLFMHVHRKFVFSEFRRFEQGRDPR